LHILGTAKARMCVQAKS